MLWCCKNEQLVIFKHCAMATFNHKKYFYFLSPMILCLALASCDPVGSKKCYPCPEAPTLEPYLTFKVVGTTSGNNLFFGSAAVYKQSQVKVYHLVNGQQDSIHLTPDTAAGSFRMNVPTQHSTDTVTMNIASLQQDVFLFKTTTSSGCCSTQTYNGVVYNGVMIFDPSKGPAVVVISK
jgi:hypothetical protein